MRKIAILLTFFLFSTAFGRAEEWPANGNGNEKLHKRLWRASLAALAAGSAMDIQSSMGKHEVNGMLANHSGTFAAQGIGLKLAIAGAAAGTQHFLLKRNPSGQAYKMGTAINFAVAGTLVGASVHNYGTKAGR